MIDTHIHLDGEEFDADRAAVIDRARAAGVSRMFIPSVDLASVSKVLSVCRSFAGYAYPMIGLHPEEVKDDYREVLAEMKTLFTPEFIAIGEIGLDYYWSREFEKEQLVAFEEQVCWSLEVGLPLMIHCRKAQNEMVGILRHYEKELLGGVFHCFTGNEKEAAELLSFERFALGIGGVLTFKNSRLPEVLSSSVGLDRIVLETDAPYMAPVPMRGKRNESAFLCHVVRKLSECYNVSEEAIAEATNRNVERIFKVDE